MASRVGALMGHLSPGGSSGGFSAEEMGRLLNGADQTHRDEAFAFMKHNPLFKLDYNASKESLRHLTRARVLAMYGAGFLKPVQSESDERFIQYNDAFSYHDSSVNTLIGAQLVLFTGSILRLGTEFHHQEFLRDAEAGRLRGCFALTELGHGSNVRGIETTATFDPERDEFVINTPTETAQKYWIGGGAEWASIATVFAQLYVKGVHFGVHALLVPLRDEHGRILPGVRIKDCGHKMGLNGMDNGRFWFDNVRVPRTHLLDRYGHVTREGEYESVISNNDSRFAVTMGNLLTGRVSISRGSTNVCKIALATAIRYAHTRKQFGPPGAEELPIIEYVTHQVRLMPLLATTFANHFAAKKALHAFLAAQEAMDIDAIKEVHVLVSGMKALTTWHLAETLQTCREACGGQGYKSSNRIGILKADADIQLTYEGDNSVLLQQVSKDLIKAPASSAPPVRIDLELKNRTDPGYLASAENQLKVFELRESDLVTRLRAKYGQARAEGKSSDDALQTCATLATEAGRAHIERRIFEEFVEVERGAPQALQDVLGALRSLYAISRFDSSPSFLREQYFGVEKQQAIHIAFVQLCRRVKENSLLLVDSFQIPAFLLGDIAGDWVAKNSFASEDSV